MNPRRRMFKEDTWACLNPVQKGLVIGVGPGALLWAFPGTLVWLAVGVGPGVFLRRRRSPATTPPQPWILQ